MKRRRVIPWVLLGLVVLACVGAVLNPGTLRAREARREAIKLLSVASTQEELQDAAGYLGVVLHNQQGDWIAIRYRDSHSSPGYFSKSVAHCSDGTWFESDVHYCGLLSGYRKQCEMRREMLAYAETDEERERIRNDCASSDGDMLTLAQIEEAVDLASMKSRLETLGFEAMAAPE